jgi:hypothetical protein
VTLAAFEPETVELPSGDLVLSSSPHYDLISPPDADGICTVTPTDDEPYAIIPLHGKYGRGLVAKVSLQDVARVRRYRWYVSQHGYVTTVMQERGKRLWGVRLHRYVLGIRNGMKVIVDHRHHDKLDNRRSQIRVVSNMQNAWNQRGLSGGTSKYKGVSRAKKDKRWNAGIKINETSIPLGGYETEIEAARAYDAAALFHFGEFAYVNFEDSVPRSSEEIRQEAHSARPKTSKYLGVRRKKGRQGFQVRVKEWGRETYVGSFADEEQAARAYDACIRFLYGSDAKTNFPGTEVISPDDMRAQRMGGENVTRKGKSRYKGVHWHKRSGKWAAMFIFKGTNKRIGLFASEVSAARAVDDARIARGLLRANFPEVK